MLENPGGAGANAENLSAYRLGLSSPCRKRGVVVENPGERDVLGVKLPKGVPSKHRSLSVIIIEPFKYYT